MIHLKLFLNIESLRFKFHQNPHLYFNYLKFKTLRFKSTTSPFLSILTHHVTKEKKVSTCNQQLIHL